MTEPAPMALALRSEMTECSECCHTSNKKAPVSLPQHPLLSLPRVMVPASPSSPLGGAIEDSPVNPYNVLQVRRDANIFEIRQAYKRLALWHHPGRRQPRSASAFAERRQRYESFELLGACYETLTDPDSRSQYDNMCKEMEQTRLQAGVKGALFVGGKPFVGALTPTKQGKLVKLITLGTTTHHNRSRSQDTYAMDDVDRIPTLSRASTESSYSFDGEEEIVFENETNDHHDVETKSSCLMISPETPGCSAPHTSPRHSRSRVVPAANIIRRQTLEAPSLVDSCESSCSEDEEEAETHYTEATTRRLFGGPLAHLHKARNFKPFGDPYDVFEHVFHSQIFDRISREEIMKSCSSRAGSSGPAKSERLRSTAGWHGSSQTSPDGRTTIFTTFRIVNDRCLTRTETVTTIAPGITRSNVTVTGETLQPANILMEDDDVVSGNACSLCYDTTPTSVVGSGEDDDIYDKGGNSFCADIFELYHNIVDELDLGRHQHMFHSWSGVFAFANPFFSPLF